MTEVPKSGWSMSPGLFVAAGVALVIAGSLLTQLYVRRAHGVATEATVAASEGNRTVPSWVSLLVIVGWPTLIAGILWALASWVL